MALIRLCNFGKSYWSTWCTSQRCWPWSISWLIPTWWAIYWQANIPLNLGGNEAGVLQHSAPSLAFYHCKNFVCPVKLCRWRLTASYGVVGSDPAHRSPPCEPFPNGVYCTAILLSPTWLKYHHAYCYRDHLYSTAICANPYHSLTPTHMIELLLILLIAVLGLVICRDAL